MAGDMVMARVLGTALAELLGADVEVGGSAVIEMALKLGPRA